MKLEIDDIILILFGSIIISIIEVVSQIDWPFWFNLLVCFAYYIMVMIPAQKRRNKRNGKNI